MTQDRRKSQRRPSPRRSTSAKPTGDFDALAEWERELLGLSTEPVLKAVRKSAKFGPGAIPRTRAENRKQTKRALRLSNRSPRAEQPKRRPRTNFKPKTAEAAQENRRTAEIHKRGKFTRDFSPRKSRRSLKREIYGQREDQS